VDIGVATADLRGHVLPAFSYKNELGGVSEARSAWETPVMTLPLTCVSLGDRPDMCALGEAAGYVALVFGISVDPQLLVQAADEATRPLLDRVTRPLLDRVSAPVVEWMDQCADPENLLKLVSMAEDRVKDLLKDADWDQAEHATKELLNQMQAHLRLANRRAASALAAFECSFSDDGGNSPRSPCSSVSSPRGSPSACSI
jgi:hypothetical protein